MSIIIRTATVADAEGIGKVHVDSWRTTYKNLVSNDFLDKLTYEQRTELWVRNLTIDGNSAFVAENHEGRIVGFTSGGKREKDKCENAGYLDTIYILEQYQRMGIGKNLMKEIISKFDALGFRSVIVEVLEENDSRLFYEALGAKLFKREKTTMADAELNLLTYEWKDIPLLLKRLRASEL